MLRTVLLLWGVNKFTKKLREADPIPTNEIDNLVRLGFDSYSNKQTYKQPTNEIDNLVRLDFNFDFSLLSNHSHNQQHFFQLSRVPDHEMVEDCRDPTTSLASAPSSPTL